MELIAIVDYGAGNLGSVDKALRYLGAPARIVSDPVDVLRADAVVLPGVGAFEHCMRGLRARSLDQAVRAFIESGKPFLGICIGMQMLFEFSEEGGGVPGLGILRGKVVRFQREGSRTGLKIPHMGWNDLRICKPCPLLDGLGSMPVVYFVHSYYPVPEDTGVVVSTTDYGGPFCSAVQYGNVFATQFHPEKSGSTGLSILRNFAGLVP